jgi:small subunit ribosomal protein S1
MSLGHKQLQENPWDTFESVFEVGSTHKGTVVSIDGSNVGVALPYGVEGFCQAKHLKREDGTDIKVEESADFIVLEFNRNAKRITVSHLRTYEEPPAKKRGGSDNRKRRDDRDGGSSPATQRAVREVNERQAKTTFGDLDVLSQLKQQMEDGPAAEEAPAEEAKEAKKPAKKATKAKAKPKAKKEEVPAEEAPAEEPKAEDAPAEEPKADEGDANANEEEKA